jgi:DNA-binding LytR/AlgR family response regulator
MTDLFYFKVKEWHVKIPFAEIMFAEADGRHTIIATTSKTYVVHASISFIEEVLPTDMFCRVHKSYIISLQHTDKFDCDLAYQKNRKIPIARKYRKRLIKAATSKSIKSFDSKANSAHFSGNWGLPMNN